ncbi:MAG: MFS transporter [Myxococcales bacterium]|nr:MFS transporter [Myxococcales bacterium]
MDRRVVGIIIAVLLVAGAGMCFTWPNLEALVSEGELPASLQRNLGIYNLVWSGGNAVAYFTGGMLMDQLGVRAIFAFPAAVMIGQFLLAWRLAARSANERTGPVAAPVAMVPPPATVRERKRSPVAPATFMKMAWIANPFSYVAINTAIPLIPFLAGRLELTPTAAGIVCSVWIFARTLAFGLLWRWDGWHYRYRFMSGSYVAMVAGFLGLVLAGNLAILIVSQIVFGLALGLIYYSSLFYSMDVGDTKGEHGGLHEGAIGVGIFAGPAIAVAAVDVADRRPERRARLLSRSEPWAQTLRLLAVAEMALRQADDPQVDALIQISEDEPDTADLPDRDTQDDLPTLSEGESEGAACLGLRPRAVDIQLHGLPGAGAGEGALLASARGLGTAILRATRGQSPKDLHSRFWNRRIEVVARLSGGRIRDAQDILQTDDNESAWVDVFLLRQEVPKRGLYEVAADMLRDVTGSLMTSFADHRETES